MAFNFKQFFEGIRIKAKSILTSDTKGELEVSDSTGKLNYHNGLSRSPVVTEAHSATLTNKTIDADNNTVSNLEVDNLKAGVLNTSTTLAGASNTQVPSALAVKTYIDDGLAHQNEASEITYNNTVSGLTATNVQDAIDEVEGRLQTAESDINQVESDLLAHINDTVDAHDASAISNIPSGNLAATDVQSALNELQSDIDTRATSASLTAHTGASTGVHGVTGAVVGTTDSQTLTNKTIVVANNTITTAASGNLTSTELNAALSELQTDIDTRATNASLTAHTGASSGVHGVTGSVVGTTDSQTLSNKNLVDASTKIVDSTDPTKQIAFDVTGTTGTITTITTTQTANRSLTLPDANDTLVGRATTDTLTNKTIDADLNTITNIENADIKAGANIARNKLASGTANAIIVNDGTGVLSEMANASNSANAITLTNLKHIELQSQDDATTTGTNATLATFTAGGVRITNGSLVSLANIPAGNNGQQFVLFNRTGVSVSIKDASAAIGSAAARILTGTGADITLASNAALILSYDSVSQRWQVVGGSGSGSGAANIAIRDEGVTLTSTPSSINFVGAGVTATNTGNDVTVTINGNTTASSVSVTPTGNLTSTNVQSALVELQESIDSIDPRANELLVQTFDTAVLADFTQTGLELVTTPGIRGTKAARLIHQAATTYSFKQTKSVDNKFKGKNLTASVSIRSTALTANVTLLVRDETNNATLTSQQITTGSGSFTASITNASANITVSDLTAYNNIQVGDSITGTGIPTGTVVISKTAPSTVTLSANATATNASASLKMSALPAIQRFSFNVPDNCSSLSYTISALQEAGLPETYVDDIIVELTQQALQSASITVPKNNDTATVSYTPTGSWSTNTTYLGKWQRVNNLIKGTVNIELAGAPNAVDLTFTAAQLLNGLGLTLDTGALAGTGGTQDLTTVGVGSYSDQGTANRGGLTFVYEKATGLFRIPGPAFSDPNQTNPITWASGDNISFTFELPIVGWSANETESKTIPLTSSVLVTQPDFNLTLSHSATVAANTIIPFDTVIKSLGTGVSNNLGTFTVLDAGVYTISTTLSNNTPSNISAQILVDGVIRQYETAFNSTGAGITLTHTEYLNIGQTFSIRNLNNAAASGSTLSITKNNSTKILNPSSDQKVEIPTHELRFEGASARGTTATGIVKFDTQARIKGDGFSVVNTAADGTVITINKNGRLNVNCTLLLNGAGGIFQVTRNQTTLTGLSSVASEIMSSTQIYTSTATGNVNATFDVSRGDIIRIASDTAIFSNVRNNLLITLQEQSVSVALQNVAPFFDNSDSAVRLKTGNGFGSTNTNVRRYSGLLDNIGSDITYSDSPTLGGSFTINTSGVYNITATEQSSTATTLDLILTKNQTAAVDSNNILALSNVTNTTGFIGTVTASGVYLQKGDVIRLLVNPPASVNNTSSFASFSISKVGKTQGTVDVTPFVQIPQNEVESIESNFTTSTWGSTATGIPFANPSRFTNKGIIRVISDSVNGTYFQALKDCSIEINVGFRATAAGHNLFIMKNSPDVAISSPPTGTRLGFATSKVVNSITFVSASTTLISGDTIKFIRSNSAIGDLDGYTIIATAQSPSVATSTQQVSSDTIPFVFKSTAIVDADPVGTFNTYTYAANTNTATIATTAPTQTTSDMNLNGVRVFTRAYNASSTAAQPARVDIKIGKGLKSKEVLAYRLSGKLNQISYDVTTINAANALEGANVSYSETTGILSINAGYSSASSITSRVFVDQIADLQAVSAYFVFNASQSPSLVSIPNLQQRVAVVRYDTASTRFTLSTTNQVIPLNTLEDPTGVVTSLNANQFTLPAGKYQISFAGYFYAASGATSAVFFGNLYTSAGTPVINGTPGFGVTSPSSYTHNTGSGIITITTPTTFEFRSRMSATYTGFYGDSFASPDNNKLAITINKLS